MKGYHKKRNTQLNKGNRPTPSANGIDPKRTNRFILTVETPALKGNKMKANAASIALLHASLLRAPEFTVRVTDRTLEEEAEGYLVNEQTFKRGETGWDMYGATYNSHRTALKIALKNVTSALADHLDTLDMTDDDRGVELLLVLGICQMIEPSFKTELATP